MFGTVPCAVRAVPSNCGPFLLLPGRATTSRAKLPELIADGTVTETTRIWVPGLAEWEEWQDCAELFDLPGAGPGSPRRATRELRERAEWDEMMAGIKDQPFDLTGGVGGRRAAAPGKPDAGNGEEDGLFYDGAEEEVLAG
eukprot:SAG22_NODE_8961_length_618_cov_1.260116_1_plen_140_part_10